MEIRATEAADMNLDEGLIGLWNRNLQILEPQRIAGDIARVIEHHCFHDMSVI